MFEKQEKLDLSQEELAVISSALHTQTKILTVQASAGASAARVRLDEIKRLLVRVSELQTPETKARACKTTFGWFGVSRLFG